MTRPLATGSIVCSLLVFLAAVRLAAADLQERTSHAYDRYAEEITLRKTPRCGDSPNTHKDVMGA
jgi:hypothetical protein